LVIPKIESNYLINISDKKFDINFRNFK
jgi:hypothetical protein